MPRKGPAPKRPLVVDPVYGSSLVTQLINKVLVDGKKSTAERIVYGALNGTRDTAGDEPVATLKKAVDSVRHPLVVRSRRVVGATYQVRVEVIPGRAAGQALGWVEAFSMKRREQALTDGLSNELVVACIGFCVA